MNSTELFFLLVIFLFVSFSIQNYFHSPEKAVVNECQGTMYGNHYQCNSIGDIKCSTKLNETGLYCEEETIKYGSPEWINYWYNNGSGRCVGGDKTCS